MQLGVAGGVLKRKAGCDISWWRKELRKQLYLLILFKFVFSFLIGESKTRFIFKKNINFNQYLIKY